MEHQQKLPLLIEVIYSAQGIEKHCSTFQDVCLRMYMHVLYKVMHTWAINEMHILDCNKSALIQFMCITQIRSAYLKIYLKSADVMIIPTDISEILYWATSRVSRPRVATKAGMCNDPIRTIQA